MIEHAFVVRQVVKMDAHGPLYSWICACGRRSDGLWAYPGQAEGAWRQHKEAKEASGE